MTFSLSTTFNGTILDTVANPHHQFRIDLSRADPCHCLTVDSATGVIGDIIFNHWRNGNFWCGEKDSRLCASKSENATFYSAFMQQNGSLLSGCDSSPDASLNISNIQISAVVGACKSM